MLRLLLLRHAEAGWPHGVDDIDRPLSPQGMRDARRVGAYVADQDLVPDLALVSPARRTRETWRLVGGSWESPPEHLVDDDIYAASTRGLLQVVRERGGDASSLVLVGHSPAVPDLLATLAAPDQRRWVPLHYPPAALAVVDLAIERWADAAPGLGTVERVVTRRDDD
ncbi:histidine phosphatase family protein [Microbacterium betulae]|uniref:Histidine phosphatase family protein n=1 Tax=Microbacterium betulae TaxID=2981139 RepID=A0AA97I763_9MICO|nr:histidine phosphatase family protein [Microbacterium sp. AB]WOF23297.1 histidine phosphatase family protein [Microbacterium sp. AB]